MADTGRGLHFPQPGHSLFAFAAVLAGLWAFAVGTFATAGHLFGPEGERGSWGEVVGAIGGNFVVVFVLCFAISLIVRAQQRRARG